MRRAVVAAGLAWLAASGSVLAKEPSPTGSPSAPGYQPIGADEQGLWAEAAELERELKGSKLLVRDAGLNAYLRSVLCRAAGTDRCGAIRIYLMRSPHFDAAIAPNGFLTITTGALLRLRNEAELAAVLGHEFTHFEKRHSLVRHKSARNSAGWASWLGAISVASGYGVNFWPALMGAHFSFSRDNEREADLGGLQLMAGSGYRTRAAGQVWAQLRDEQDAKAAALQVKSLKDAYRGPFASHPMDVERMTYLNKAAETVGVGNSFAGEHEYHSALKPVWPMMVEDQIKLNDFGTSEFMLRTLAGEGWTGQLLYARGELYRFRGKPGDFEQAAGFYREAMAKPDAPAGAWRGLGLALARTGDMAGAKAAIDEYLQRNPAAPDKAMLAMIGGS